MIIVQQQIDWPMLASGIIQVVAWIGIAICVYKGERQ
jgi:hypothetical protein